MQPLPYESSGNKNSKQMVIFLHGWPDTTRLWDEMIPNFEKDYYILNISYPNYSKKEVSKWGNDIPELIKRIKATIDSENKTNRKITIVAHDWGAVFAYYLDGLYPGYINDLIAIDISPWFNIKLYIIAYQLVLIFAFLIGGKIGDAISQRVVKFFKYTPPYFNEIKASWGYPYYYFWRQKVRKLFGLRPKKDTVDFSKYFPSCPIAFVWGSKKPVMFHNNRWLEKVREGPDNIAQEFNCGHWVMKSYPNELVDLIKKRLLRIALKLQ